MLAAIVGIHEGGHFAAARLQGIHVTQFAIGFGPPILKYQARAFAMRALHVMLDCHPTSMQVCTLAMQAHIKWLKHRSSCQSEREAGKAFQRGLQSLKAMSTGAPQHSALVPLRLQK